MSRFLSELERELHAAHGRRHAARRRASARRALRSVPAVAAAVVLIAGALAFVLAVGDGDPQRERSTTRPERARPAIVPAERELEDRRLVVLNPTEKQAPTHALMTFLTLDRPLEAIGNPSVADVERTTVRYRPALVRAAERLADRIDARVQPIGDDLPEVVRDADFVIVVGSDIRGAHAVPLHRQAGGSSGTVTVLDRVRRPDSVRILSPRRTGAADGIWLLGGGEKPRFLGYVDAGARRLDVTFTAPETAGRRLVVSAERAATRVGSEPRSVLLYADL